MREICKKIANFFRIIESLQVEKESALPKFYRNTGDDMKRISILLSLVLMIGLFAAACPKRTSIADIENNPSKYYEKEVAVAGTVKDSYGISIPLLRNGEGGIYKIDDGSGTIWVITKRSVPTKGAQLGVKGKVQNGVNYNGKNYGLVIIEDDRRFKDK